MMFLLLKFGRHWKIYVQPNLGNWFCTLGCEAQVRDLSDRAVMIQLTDVNNIVIFIAVCMLYKKKGNETVCAG